VQAVVSRLVGHYVPHLRVTCAPARCVATDGQGLVVVLVRNGKRYVIRSAID
jgi:hypothetical protein